MCIGMTSAPQPYRDEIIQDAADLAAMAEALGRSADFRVLRRLVPRTEFAVTNGQATKTGVLLDTETTGLDHSKDEIIELGMVKFDYLPDGRIAGVRDTFSAFNEPSIPSLSRSPRSPALPTTWWPVTGSARRQSPRSSTTR
jgi:DNA polymerase-3 subunit epsilon